MKQHSFFFSCRTGFFSQTTGLNAGILAVAVLATGLMLPGTNCQAQAASDSQTATAAQSQQPQTAPASAPAYRQKKKEKKAKVAKADRVQATKDTRTEMKKEKKDTTLIGADAKLPDQQLYEKAMAQQKSGHFDIARLDLQTLLNTYPDSQYQMRAKLAVADSWYREGGSAALAQAEQEYTDFITFFPNSPEAAEAQMRVGDIYFKQMDVPDRDYSKAEKAEDAYRTMLKQYPDAPASLLKECKQKLREVQEVLATREAEIGAFYASRNNWPATIARYQTVVDTYPQYSHMDDTLIGIGDAYAAEARAVRNQPVCIVTTGPQPPCLPEGARSKLLQEFDGKAAAEYRTVVLLHSAAPHAEDAKERLAAMNLPIPVPTKEEMAASEELEGSRAQYTMTKRLALLFLHEPDTVTAAQSGNPPLDDPAATVAPTVVKEFMADYKDALNPAAAANARAAAPKPTPSEAAPAQPTAAPAAPAEPLALKDVPTAGSEVDNNDTTTMEESAPSSSGRSGTGVGIEVLTPGVTTKSPEGGSPSGVTTPASDLPAATGAPDPNGGLSSVGPKNRAPLPPVEKPAEAPDQVNEVAGKTQPATQTTTDGKKAPKTAYDKDDESSSTHKKKKGIDKLNPF